MNKQAIELLSTISPALYALQLTLSTSWTQRDLKLKEELTVLKNEIGYTNFGLLTKYTKSDKSLVYKSEREIKESNEKDAKYFIINLIKRVEKKIGTIVDFSGLSFDVVINGYFIGTEGRTNISTIVAGGYNVQKLHHRIILK